MLLALINFINNHIKGYPTPISLSYAWSFGALTGIFLSIQLVTGVLLGIHYNAGEFAFESVEYIMRDVNYGWLLRYLHSNSASFYFLCMYIHIGRAIFYKSYLTPRNFAWNSGVFILLLSIVTAFLGYVLPWGQMSYWAATVIIKLLTIIPSVGQELVEWLWGDFAVASLTLIRFFDLHYTLSIILIVFVIWHISFVHEVGSSTIFGLDIEKDLRNFGAFFISKDGFILLSVLFNFLIVVFYFPNLLSHPDNYIKADPLVTPNHIVPEWYFSPFYAILRSFETKALGVLMLISSILVLMALPLCKEDVKDDRFIFGFNLNWFFFVFITNFVCLGYIGSVPAVYPFIQAGQLHTFIYFISISLFFYFCRAKNRYTRFLVVSKTSVPHYAISTRSFISKSINQLKKNKMTMTPNYYLLILLDIVEDFTFMEKLETLKANPYYVEDCLLVLYVFLGLAYFFLSRNKYCVRSLFQKVFFAVIKIRVKENFNKNLISYVSIWYFYGLTLYLFKTNIKGLATYATTYETYIQLPLFISFLGFSLAVFIAWGEYKFLFFGGFLPVAIPPLITISLYLIEFLSFCIRLLSLAARLFINILAGHILLKLFANAVVLIGMHCIIPYISLTFILYFFGFMFYFLEYLAAFLQAAVAATLISIYVHECIKFAKTF